MTKFPTPKFNRGSMEYGYSQQFRKWYFNIPTGQLLLRCKGNENAHECARLLDVPANRLGLAKQNVYRLLDARTN